MNEKKYFISIDMDVFTSFVSTHKRNSFDIRMFDHMFNSIETSMGNIENTIGQANVFHVLTDKLHGARNSFRRFHHKGISQGDRNGEHPQRDHGWEIERTHTSGYS